MNITKRFKRRTEYRLHRLGIIKDFNKRWQKVCLQAFERMKKNGVMKIVRTKLGTVEGKGYEFY